MKLGIYLNSQHRERDDPARRLAETLEQARLIRALGFDSIWAGEHHLVPGFHYFPQPPLLVRIAVEAGGGSRNGYCKKAHVAIHDRQTRSGSAMPYLRWRQTEAMA
jgi:hypothetical protein